MGDVHHFFGKLGNLSALECLEVFELLAGHTILVIVVALVNDVFRTELVTHFLFKLLQDIRADGSRITVPVHIFFSF